MSGGIRITDSLTKGLALASAAFPHHLEEEVLDTAAEALEYAKTNAPWSDRTGDARDGLDTEVEWEGNDIAWYLYHTVEYGPWLELIQNGRYAIIMPTLEMFAPKVGKNLSTRTEVDYA